MLRHLLFVTIAVSSLVLNHSDAVAQGPPPIDPATIELAAMPSVIADGAGYHISGVVTGIPDGAEIKITIVNHYTVLGIPLDPPPTQFTLIVEDSCFYAPTPSYFHGEGIYSVSARHLPDGGLLAIHTIYGTVSAP